MTKLTASIVAESNEQAIRDIRKAQTDGADAIEIRLDYLQSPDFRKLVKNCSLPIIWTLRHISEGGKFTGSVDEQFDILKQAIEAGGNYIDIEHRRWEESSTMQRLIIERIDEICSEDRKVNLILSFHDFESTPHYLSHIAHRIRNTNYADIVKVACKINNICENFYILDLLKRSNKPTIAIGMGELGTISRILSAKFGAEITFAAIEQDKTSAPGQLTIKQLKDEYNWDNINRQTKVAGVVGHPIKHSLSPIMHNRAYKQMNINAVYLQLDVPEDYGSFAMFIDFIRERPGYDFIGLSVTIPHKTNALEYLKKNKYEIDPLAEKIGAVNTIAFLPDGRLVGYNTDYLGVLESLRAVGGIDRADLAGKRLAVLGAGGVARAIVAAMTCANADVTIYNRTESKAVKLAEQFNCSWEKWDKRNEIEADIIINGTSIGMLGNEDASPLESDVIKADMVVFDTVYNPLETKLLKMAKQAGAKTIDGANMLVYQAIEQIKIWLDAWKINYNAIPAGIMKQAVLDKLKRDNNNG